MTNEQYIWRRAERFLETTKVSTDISFHFSEQFPIEMLEDSATRKTMRVIDELLIKLNFRKHYTVRQTLGCES